MTLERKSCDEKDRMTGKLRRASLRSLLPLCDIIATQFYLNSFNMLNKIESGLTLNEDQATAVFEAVKADILKAVDPNRDEALKLGYMFVRLEMQFIFGLYEAIFSPEFDEVLPLDMGLELREMKREVSEAILHAGSGKFTSLKRYLQKLGKVYVEDEEQADLGKQLIVLSGRITAVGAPVAG